MKPPSHVHFRSLFHCRHLPGIHQTSQTARTLNFIESEEIQNIVKRVIPALPEEKLYKRIKTNTKEIKNDKNKTGTYSRSDDVLGCEEIAPRSSARSGRRKWKSSSSRKASTRVSCRRVRDDNP
jgi:hypothetical protein